jgi:hypothetical protein
MEEFIAPDEISLSHPLTFPSARDFDRRRH